MASRGTAAYFWTGVGCLLAFLSGRADAQSIYSLGGSSEAQRLATEEIYANESPSQSRPHSGPGIGGNRVSLAGWRSYGRYLKSRGGSEGQSDSAGSETARVGPVKFTLEAGMSFAVDNNINNSPDNPLLDEVVSASIDLGIDWQITQRNNLKITLGFDYSQYLRYTQYNSSGLNIAPNTSFDYRIYFGDMVLSFYDQPSITNGNGGGENSPAVTNSVNFRQFTNSGGLSLLWNPNQLIFVVGLERMDTVSLTSNEFTSQNSYGYSAYGAVSFDVTPTTRVGLRSQISTMTYSEQVLNDGIMTRMGVVLESRLSVYTTYSLEVGLQTGTFTQTGKQGDQLVFQSNSGFNTDIEDTLGGGDYSQPYFIFTMSNRLNRHLSHSFGLSREATGSSVSNYQEVTTASYQLQYRLNRIARITFETAYEYGGISNSSSRIPYTTWEAAADISLQIAKDSSIAISYGYYLNNLSGLAANYDRQIITFSLSHSF